MTGRWRRGDRPRQAASVRASGVTDDDFDLVHLSLGGVRAARGDVGRCEAAGAVGGGEQVRRILARSRGHPGRRALAGRRREEVAAERSLMTTRQKAAQESSSPVARASPGKGGRLGGARGERFRVELDQLHRTDDRATASLSQASQSRPLESSPSCRRSVGLPCLMKRVRSLSSPRARAAGPQVGLDSYRCRSASRHRAATPSDHPPECRPRPPGRAPAAGSSPDRLGRLSASRRLPFASSGTARSSPGFPDTVRQVVRRAASRR